MQNKLRQLIISALRRNDYTADLPIQVRVVGYDVTISGYVPADFIRSEVVATIESVSPYLRIHNRLKVAEQYAMRV